MAFSTVPFTETLAQQGFVILDQFLDEDLVQGLFEECKCAWERDEFDLAGIGAGKDFQLETRVRSNQVLWWDPHNLLPFQAKFCLVLDRLMEQLNRELFLGLQTYETHFGGYAPGTFYKKHEDSFRNRNNRRISLTFYLNRDWQAQDGGQLVLYLKDSATVSILPEWNRLVMFVSEGMPHEVLPTQRTRFLIANWFKHRHWPLK